MLDNSLLEIYIFENLQLLEQLDGLLLSADKSERFNSEQVASIFRILHTIKGSSAMMEFDYLTKLSHAMEDLFGYIRDNISAAYDHRKVCDLVFSAEDYLRAEIENLQAGVMPSQEPGDLITSIKEYFAELKNGTAPATPAAITAQAIADTVEAPIAVPASNGGARAFYKAVIYFEPECKMENIRAFGVVKSIESLCKRVLTIPEDLLKDHTDEFIIEHGFTMFIESETDFLTLKIKIESNILIASLQFEELTDISQSPLDRRSKEAPPAEAPAEAQATQTLQQMHNYMSVRLDRLDKLMDLVGEIVITESTVTKNPDIVGLHMENFSKAARQLRKLTDELQDTVMAIRMIPISATFHKMERIVRDVAKKTNKQANLQIYGEDTEMDKNVIDNLSDPLMHIVRNAVDHGIEPPDFRESIGKPRTGCITIEARSVGGDVVISVSDDGKGLIKEKLIAKGIENGLIKKPASEITDKEAYAMIFAPGFSTNDSVTEFSGRGVGMDVVTKNIQKMGGSISVDSTEGFGMTVTMRIPLTLAIIDGMQVRVGDSIFIIPLLSIQESFKPKPGDVFFDPDGNEMMLIRETCYSVVRLHQILGIHTDIINYEDGILILMDSDAGPYCLFVDCLIGEQQTVIKPMPYYIAHTQKYMRGIAGCTILGDGSISLILDINDLI